MGFLPLAGDGDVFALARGTSALAVGRGWNCASDVVLLDTTEGRRGSEVVRLAIGAGCGKSALFPVSQTLIDAVRITLVGNDEDPAIGKRHRRGADGKYGSEK